MQGKGWRFENGQLHATIRIAPSQPDGRIMAKREASNPKTRHFVERGIRKGEKIMKLNELKRQKLERQHFWQWAKHVMPPSTASLPPSSNLVKAWKKRKGKGGDDIHFCVRGTPRRDNGMKKAMVNGREDFTSLEGIHSLTGSWYPTPAQPSKSY